MRRKLMQSDTVGRPSETVVLLSSRRALLHLAIVALATVFLPTACSVSAPPVGKANPPNWVRDAFSSSEIKEYQIVHRDERSARNTELWRLVPAASLARSRRDVSAPECPPRTTATGHSPAQGDTSRDHRWDSCHSRSLALVEYYGPSLGELNRWAYCCYDPTPPSLMGRTRIVGTVERADGWELVFIEYYLGESSTP